MNQTPTWKQVLARNQAFAQQQEQRSIENQLMKLQQEQSANQPQKNWLQKLGDFGIGVVKSTAVPVYEALATTAAAGIEGVRNAMGKHEKALDTANRMSQANRDDWAKSAGFSSYQDAMANADKVSDDQWQKLQNINEYANKELERQKSAYEGDWARQRIAKETQENFAANAGQTLLTAASIMAPMASGAALTRGGAALTRAAQQVGSKIPGVIAKPAMALGRAAFAPTASQSIIGSAAKSAIQSGLQGAASGALEGYRRGEDVGESALQAAGTAALTGAALGAAGAGIQRIQAGRQARQGAAQAIADTADDAALSSLNQQGAKSQVQAIKDKTADRLLGMQTKLTKAEAKQIGVSPGRAVKKLYQKTGLTDLEKQAAMASEVTGANGFLDDIQTSRMKQYVNPSNKAKIADDAYNVMNQKLTNLAAGGKTAKQNVLDAIRSDVIESKNLLSLSNNLKDDAIDMIRKGVNPSNSDRVTSRAMLDVADILDDAIYKNASPSTVKSLFSDARSQAAARVQEATKAGNTEMANAWQGLLDDISNAPQTIKGFRSIKKDFVDISKINRYTQTADNTMQQFAGSIQGIPAAIANEAIRAPFNTAAAKAGAVLAGRNAAAGTTQAGIVKTLIGAKPTQGYPSVPLLARALGAGTSVTQADDRQGAAANANINEQIAKLTSQLGTLQGGGAINAGMLGAPTMQQEPSFGGYKMSDYETAAMSALQAGDTKAYQHYASIYDMLAKQATSGQGDLSVAQMNRLADLQSSSSALDELEGLFSQAGGGQGIILGNVRNVLGGVGADTAASTYNAMAQGLINQILKGIGKTDALNTEGEVQRALEMVPRITDNKQTALNKLASLRRILGTTQSSLASTYGIQ